MTFWTSPELEPLRKFRFKVQFGNDVMWWAKSVTQPSPDVSVSEHQLINHKIKYPGIVTWNDIDITFVDTGNEGKNLMTDLELYGYDTDGSEDGLKKNFPGFRTQPPRPLFNLLITKINSHGHKLETWTLINPFIKAIKYGDLDYSSDELVEITLTVAYDSATLD